VIAADEFLAPAAARGLDFYTGVPCSFLTPIINRVIGDTAIEYVGAASEGEAVAIAAGAWLAGRGTVVMCQNSGLGNAVNPLTSLNHPFRIPTLLIVTWRGQPGLKDEPQHELMGEITGKLLDVIEVPHAPFPDHEKAVGSALDTAGAVMATDQPFAFIMEKGAVRDDGLDQAPRPARPAGTHTDQRGHGARPARVQVLELVLALVPEAAAVIATTGKCGRELFTLADRPQHLYQVGSMGCASAMGLGVALNAARPVVVLDGDGAALMKMGSLATVGAYAPGNLVHVVLDNGAHDSTGGQATVSASVDFAEVAVACGYASGSICDDTAGFDQAFRAALAAPGPHLIHARIAPGSMANLGRPTVKPAGVARRFKEFVSGAE
jgi:phosphonopyruvate decarboxylase